MLTFAKVWFDKPLTQKSETISPLNFLLKPYIYINFLFSLNILFNWNWRLISYNLSTSEIGQSAGMNTLDLMANMQANKNYQNAIKIIKM